MAKKKRKHNPKVAKRNPNRHNPVAKELRTSKWKTRVVPAKEREPDARTQIEDELDDA